jgi:arylsulfatase
MEKRPNILFIVVDALRARNLGCYGYSKSTSPNIDNLAREGALFQSAYSCATTTHPSFTSIFSGRYPLSHGIMKHERMLTPKDVKTLDDSGTVLLPEVLKSNGYKTLAIDWLGRWHRRGYDYYSGTLSRQRLRLYWLLGRVIKLERLSTYIAHRKLIDHGGVVTNRAVETLRKFHGERFFLLLHYWDTHIPYNPPKRYVKQFIDSDYGKNQSLQEICSQFDTKHAPYMRHRIFGTAKDTNEVQARYDGAIAFVDYQIKRLIETLERYGILDETLIIITSDHGESLTEHEIYFGHHGLYDVTIHVPLIFRWPEFAQKRKIQSFIQHVDIVPTLYDLLGIKAKTPLDGRSLVPLVDEEIRELRSSVYVEEADAERKVAIRTCDYKYIRALSEKDAVCNWCGKVHGGPEELYDLNEDPEENQNLVKERVTEAQALKEELGKLENSLSTNKGKKQVEERGEKPVDRSSDEEEKLIAERLKNLGYF